MRNMLVAAGAVTLCVGAADIASRKFGVKPDKAREYAYVGMIGFLVTYYN